MAGNNRIQFSLDFAKGDTSALQSLKKDLMEIKTLASDLDFTSGMEPKQIQSMVTAATTLEKALNNAFDVNLNTYNVQKFNQLLSQSGYNATTLQAALGNAGTTGQQAFLKATSQLMKFNTATKQTNKFLDDMATSFFNTVRWSAMSSILNNITGTAERAVGYIKNLDTSLNDIRIVTGKSADEMSRFAVEANNAAKELAVTTKDYAEGSLIYYQQGLDDETVKTLTDITAKTSNVTGQSMEEVSEQLTAVWNGYQVANEAAKEGMGVYEEYVDKMAAVGAATASDLEELSVAMSKVASAASSMGVDFDDLNAQIATIVSVTRQAPESVGTALKTIYARLGDLSVDGVDEFGVSLGKISQQLKIMGIDILDTNGDMRDMTSVMGEVAEKWNAWTSAQKQAAAIAMAGKRQYNNLIALFDNWDMYSESLETSMNAVGTLEEQQDIALDSLQRKMIQLQATAEDLYDSLFDENTLKGLTEAGITVLQLLADFIDSVGGLNTILPMLGSTGLRVFKDQIASGISTVIINAKNAGKEISMMEQNANQLRLMFADSQLFDVFDQSGTSDVANQQIAKLTDFYGRMQQYQSMMTAEEKEQYNLILNNIEKSGDLAIQAEKARNEWKDSNNELKMINASLVQSIDDVDKLALEVNKVNKLANEFEGWGTRKTNDFIKNNFSNFLHDFEGDLKLTSDQIEALEKRFIELGDATPKEKIAQISSELRKIGAETGVITKLGSESKQTAESCKYLGDALEEGLAVRKRVSDITNIIGAVGQLSISLNTLTNIASILKNDDLTFGEKFLQTTMNLSFALPGLISSVRELGSSIGYTTGIMKTFGALQTRNNAIQVANTLGLELNKKAIKDKTAAEIQDLVVTKILDKYEIILNGTRVTSATVLTAEQKAQLLAMYAKQGDIVVTKESTVAQNLLNKSILAFPGFWLAAVLAIIVGGLVAYNKAQTQALKNTVEENKKTIEKINTIQEEIKANEELYDSYINLYAQYKEGKVEKDALYEVTDQLCEKYNIENGYLAKLTGNYDKLTEAIKNARKAELEEGKEKTQKEIDKAGENVEAQARLSKAGVKIGKDYSTIFNVGFALEKSDTLANKYLSETGYSLAPIEYTAENIVKQYEQIQTAVENMNKAEEEGGMSAAERQSSEVYKNAVKYLSEMSETYEEYKAAVQDLQDFNVQSILEENDLSRVDSIQKYSKTVNTIREQLLEEFDGDTEKVNEIITNYINGLDNEFAKTQYGLELLRDQLGLTENEYFKLRNWSDEDIALLLSGKIEFDGIETEEQLRQALEVAKSHLTEEDLSIAVSLRTKMASDKKLTKKDLEEAQLETSNLAQDYEVEFDDFDNQSQLDQIDILNKIVNEKIELNHKYIENAKETAEEEKEIVDERLNNLEKEKEALEKKNSIPGVSLTDEERDRLKELPDLIANVKDESDKLAEIAKNGLSFEEVEEINFDNLISGIEGVITKADVLKDLAAEIGENWTIAADDIKEVALNFPELLSAQENYNVLQDGSVQLTEQGRVALEGLVQERKKELIAENEAYQIELQKQADLQYAAADYYAQQAEYIQQYLDGKMNASEAEKNMQQALSDYENKTIEIVAGNDAKAKQKMINNLAIATTNAQANLKSQYDAWCSLGGAIAAAAEAELSGSFNPPGFTGGGATTSSTETFQGDAIPDSSSIFSSVNAAKAQLASLKKAEEKARNRGDQLLAEKALAGANTQAALNAMDNAASGKGGDYKGNKGGGKGKNKGKSGSDKKKEEKEEKAEIDRYHDLNRAIELTERSLDRLNKKKEKYTGKALIKALKHENKLLKEQRSNYNKLINEQKKEAGENKKLLKNNYGFKFNKNNEITNYKDVLGKKGSETLRYENAIKKYNKSNQDEKDKNALQAAEDRWKRVNDLAKNYEELVDKIEDERDKREEERLKEIENNFKAFDTKIHVNFDKREIKRSLNELNVLLNKNIKKSSKDLSAEMSRITKDTKTYFDGVGKNATGDIAALVKGIKSVQGSITRLQEEGVSKNFESISKAKETLKDYYNELKEKIEDLQSLYEEAWNTYLEAIDQATDRVGDLFKEMERLNGQLEFQGQLIELIYGEKAYGLLNQYYNAQQKASLERIDSLKKYRDEAEAEWKQAAERNGDDRNDAYSTWSDDTKKWYDQMVDYDNQLTEEITNNIDIITNKRNKAAEEALDNYERAMLGGFSVDEVTEDWERATEYADKYYDSVEKSYQIDSLSAKMEKEISATNNLKIQQRLNKVKEDELNKLREMDKLTEYDVKRAELRYQLELKQIALENSRNNKKSMKLTRNSEGNWSYQYVADDSDIKSKMQDVTDLKNQMYELDRDALKNSEKQMIDFVNSYKEQMSKLEELHNARLISDEEYTRRRDKLEKYHNDYVNDLARETTKYQDNLQVSSANLILDIYNKDEKAYDSMTTEEKRLIDKLKTHNTTTYEDLETTIKGNIDGIGDESKTVITTMDGGWAGLGTKLKEVWDSETGVKQIVTGAYDAIDKANDQFKKDLEDLSSTSGIPFDKDHLGGELDKILGQIGAIKDKITEVVGGIPGQLQPFITSVQELQGVFDNANASIQTAIGSLTSFLSVTDDVNDLKDKTYTIKTKHVDEYIKKYKTVGSPSSGSGSGSSGGGSSSSGKTSNTKTNTTSNKTKTADTKKYYIFKTTKGKDPSIPSNRTTMKDNMTKSEAQEYWKQHAYDSWNKNKNRAYDYYLKYHGENAGGGRQYKTGGYTGEWGSEEGRLAVLHQKELVLNKEDTKNFLEGINLIRDMSSLNGSISNAIMQAIANMMSSLTGRTSGIISGGTESNTSQNVFNITAEFPNAENVNEIREAILSLPNLASQYINQKLL